MWFLKSCMLSQVENSGSYSSPSLKFFVIYFVSLIIETTCEEGIYLPTKCVDAFQCSKPIFCVSPKIGTLRDIVEKFHVGYISDIDNIDDVVSQTKRMLNDHLQHQLPVANKKIAPVFFEEYIAEQFAELLK